MRIQLAVAIAAAHPDDAWMRRTCVPASAPDDTDASFNVFAPSDSHEATLLRAVPDGVPFPVIEVPEDGGGSHYRLAEPDADLAAILKAARKPQGAASAPETAGDGQAGAEPLPIPQTPHAEHGGILARITGLIDRDPLVLIERYRETASEAARMRGRKDRLEHERKRVLARVSQEVREDVASGGGKVTVAEVDDRARASEDYEQFLDEYEHVSIEAERLNSLAWAIKNEVDVVIEAVRFHRTEMQLLGAEDRAHATAA